MALIITHKLHMDLEGKEGIQRIEVSQWDTCTRQIRLALFAGPIPWVIPDDAQIRIQYRKADGIGGDYDTLPDGTAAWLAEGNLLALQLAPQVLTVAGTVELQASILLQGKCLHTFVLEVLVRPTIKGDRGEESREYTYLTGIMPVPETGAVGQYLRIAQVDDYDRVIRVEATDAPECTGVEVYMLSQGETIEDAPADMDVVVDPNGDADLKFGTVKSVNGEVPDENGNLEIEFGTVKSVNGVAPDESGNVVIETGSVKSVNGVTPNENGNVVIETGTVKSVNGVTPNANGNVQIEVDGVKTVNGAAPDENGNIEIEAGGASNLEELLPIVQTLPETSLSCDNSGMAYIFTAFTLVSGKNYVVNWKGTEYNCTAASMEYNGLTGIAVGNIGAISGGTNTGEPFLVAELDEPMGTIVGIAAALDGSATASVSICEPKKSLLNICLTISVVLPSILVLVLTLHKVKWKSPSVVTVLPTMFGTVVLCCLI